MDKGENGVILFPNYQKLKENIERMKIELSMLLLERDELKFVVCKNIETAYCLKFGAIEHKAYEAQCVALRLKRKIDLIQRKINRQEKIVIKIIEQMLDEEFAEYQKKLNEQIEKMNEAIERSNCKKLTDSENKELKKLYRIIVKNLHPDVNPNVSEVQIRLLENAISAYKGGDIVTLRTIELMVGEQKLPEQSQDAMNMLFKENERLESMLATVKEQISEIKNSYPYTVRDIVEDSQKEKERREEVENILGQYQKLIEIYKAKLSEMLR